jgi:CheY-like chemotaxis protein
VTRDFLVSNGYKVLLAAEASEALDIASEFRGRIHLLLADVDMPHMNGRELSERLAEQRPDLKVLLELDVAFIEKPFTQEALGGESGNCSRRSSRIASIPASFALSRTCLGASLVGKRRVAVMKITQYCAI